MLSAKPFQRRPSMLGKPAFYDHRRKNEEGLCCQCVEYRGCLHAYEMRHHQLADDNDNTWTGFFTENCAALVNELEGPPAFLFLFFCLGED